MKLVEEFNTQTKDLKFGEIMIRINSHQVVLGNWSYLSASFFFFFFLQPLFEGMSGQNR